MSLEIIRETNHLTITKARNHSKLLILLGCSLSAFLTFSFFAVGAVQADPMYRDLPSIASAPILAIGSFNAVMITSLVILFIKSFTEISASKVKNTFEGRNNAKIEANAEAIHNRLDQYGQKDYSLQIDEVKQGLENQISDTKKELQPQIDEIKTDYLRRFRLQDIKLDKSERARINAENELLKERELRTKYEQLLNDRTLTKNNSENTKTKKFKDLDE